MNEPIYNASVYGRSAASYLPQWQSPQADKLIAAGWLPSLGDGYVLLLHKDAAPGVDPVKVMLNPNGTLHLVIERSHFHRQLASIVGSI